MKEERFRKMFADFGTLTDCALKFTKDGRFRKFGFVGFKTEDDAKKAMTHFNKSFVDTSKVTVSVCVCVCVHTVVAKIIGALLFSPAENGFQSVISIFCCSVSVGNISLHFQTFI